MIVILNVNQAAIPMGPAIHANQSYVKPVKTLLRIVQLIKIITLVFQVIDYLQITVVAALIDVARASVPLTTHAPLALQVTS